MEANLKPAKNLGALPPIPSPLTNATGSVFKRNGSVAEGGVDVT